MTNSATKKRIQAVMGPPVSEPRDGLAGQAPWDWEQVEDDGEVGRVLARLRNTKCMAVYARPDLYELAYPGYPGDRDYYLSEARTGHVLYLGVGTGRIFIPMASQNPQAYGVEYSPEMFCLLQGRQPQIADRLLQCDAAQAPVRRDSLDTVVAPYSFLQVLGRERLQQLLDCVHSWLRPGGRFLSDTFSPYGIPFRRRGLESNIRQISEQMRISIYILYDHVAQKMQELALIEREGESPCVLDMRLEYFFPRELVDAMERAGFDPVNVRGGFDGRPFDPVASEVVAYEAIKPVPTSGRVRARNNCSTNV